MVANSAFGDRRGRPTNATLGHPSDFGLAGTVVNNMEFLVTGSTFGDAAGVIGQNILSFADLEYDLGGGFIRLIRAKDCKDANRVYWLQPGAKFSSVGINPVTRLEPHAVGTAYLNGKKIRVLFDTGAAISSSACAPPGARREDHGGGVVEVGRIGAMLPRCCRQVPRRREFPDRREEIRDTPLRIATSTCPQCRHAARRRIFFM